MSPTQPLSARLRRRAPILLIAVAAVAGLVFFRHWLSFDLLEENHARLIALRDAHYLLTALAFMAIYVVVVVASVPGALVLTLTGGFLFGLFPGVIFNGVAATLGAAIVFLAARAGFGQELAARIAAQGGAVARLQAALRDNQVSVLLTMRLVPVVPFFVANLVPALMGIGLPVFAATTFVGIIPGGLIYTQLGAGLGEVFAQGGHADLGLIFAPRFILPLLGLALLASAPLAVKLYQSRRTGA